MSFALVITILFSYNTSLFTFNIVNLYYPVCAACEQMLQYNQYNLMMSKALYLYL